MKEKQFFESKTHETEEILKQAYGSTKVWCCRFHPTNWWHEVGCPHRSWTDKELRDAGYGHILDRPKEDNT